MLCDVIITGNRTICCHVLWVASLKGEEASSIDLIHRTTLSLIIRCVWVPMCFNAFIVGVCVTRFSNKPIVAPLVKTNYLNKLIREVYCIMLCRGSICFGQLWMVISCVSSALGVAAGFFNFSRFLSLICIFFKSNHNTHCEQLRVLSSLDSGIINFENNNITFRNYV